MNYVTYEFEKHLKNLNSNFIYQTVKNRQLSDIYHSHDFYEFITIMEGSCTQLINSNEVTFEKGSLLLLCPGDKHKFTKQSADINILALSVKSQEIKEFERLFAIESTPLSSFNIKLSSKQLRTLADLYYSNTEYEYKLLLSNFIKIYTDTFDKNKALPRELEQAMREMPKKENLKDGIDRFVALSGYSKTHLARLLKKHLNITPHEFVLNLRMSEAYNSLILTDIHIDDLALEVGYESTSHFQQIFKKKYGITPAALRKKHGSRTI